MKAKPAIGILSLGCPRNLVDSESLLGRLDLKGYRLVDMQEAQIGIINTCAFIAEAKKESIDAILDLIELKKKGRLEKIIVYGCLSQRYKYSLAKQLPEVDAFVGRISLNHTRETFDLTPRHYKYLKICEGCINHCSYCVIPQIKGKFISLESEALLAKVEEFSRQKISELNIIGQDITGYGLERDKQKGLAWILKRIIRQAKEIGWIRLLYLHPERISAELLETIRDNPKVCKYIDLPIQHINSRILKLMHRKPAREEILRLIEKIRKIIPGVAIRTSLIVGFPSETEREFVQLMDFLRQVKFERLGAFIYSREEGTAAYRLKGQIPEAVKRQRFAAIMSAQQEVARENNAKFLGRTIEVLIDEADKDYYLGRSQYDAPEVDGTVFVQSKKILKPGDFTRVRITDTLEYDLVGEVAER